MLPLTHGINGAWSSRYALENAAAVLDVGIGGMEGGAGLADVLFGAVNPSGVSDCQFVRASSSTIVLASVFEHL